MADMRVSRQIAYETTQATSLVRAHTKKMWIAIISQSLVNLYCYLYAQIIYFSPNKDQCHYFDHYAYNWSSVCTSIVVEAIWSYPIIFVFWPQKRTWYCALRL